MSLEIMDWGRQYCGLKDGFIYLLVLFKQGSSSVPKLCSPWKIDSYIQLMDQVMDWGESQTVDTKTGIVMDLWEPQTGAQRMA